MQKEIYKPLQYWLIAGLVLVLMQIAIGGITRLTDSGLSITEWNIIKGVIPPLTEEAWQHTFTLYKTEAKKQYESLHADMTLSEFKFIYFWEYFHRLWARMIGVVFLVGFLIFLALKKIDKKLGVQLLIVFCMAMLEAVFGIIMVYSGLGDDKRTWVSAYKLLIHLSIATLIFSYLYHVYLQYTQHKTVDYILPKSIKNIALLIFILVLIQIMFGGLMAGMRAGLIHPHFPVFIKFGNITHALQSSAPNSLDELGDYERSIFIKALIQIAHRITAGLLVLSSFYLFLQIKKQTVSQRMKNASIYLVTSIALQFALGAITIMLSIGRIPPFWGSLHQCTAFLVLLSIMYLQYQMRENNASNVD